MAAIQRITLPVAYNIRGQRAGGLNLDDESTTFKGNYSPYMKNMMVESTKVRKRQGYSRLGTGDAMSGIGSRLVSYIDNTGTMHLLAFTTTNAYLYNSTSDAWDIVTPGHATTPVPWTGDADDRFSSGIVTDATAFSNNGGSALCVVNNVDAVKYFEGNTSDEFATLSHGFPSFSSCLDIAEFRNHLFLIGYTDTATRCRSLAVAGTGDIDDWSSATSFATTLTDSVGKIVRSLKLGTDLVIYSDRSISRCGYIGGATIFSIPTIIQEAGLLASGALVGITRAHFFLGTDQRVYSFDQSGGMMRIGQTVENRIFADISMEKKTRISSGYDVGRKKVLFFIPTSGDDYPSKGYVINLGLDGMPWEYYEFAHTVRDIAVLRRTKGSAYCDDTEWKDLYCDAVTSYCDDKYGDENYDMACFITDDGYVYKMDEVSGYDNSSDINCEYQTEDIVITDEEEHGRFIWFSFTALSQFEGTDVFVYYSTDGGESFTQLTDSPVSLEQEWTTHRLPLDVVSRKIRFKLVQNGYGDLQLRSNFRIEVSVITPRD